MEVAARGGSAIPSPLQPPKLVAGGCWSHLAFVSPLPCTCRAHCLRTTWLGLPHGPPWSRRPCFWGAGFVLSRQPWLSLQQLPGWAGGRVDGSHPFLPSLLSASLCQATSLH